MSTEYSYFTVMIANNLLLWMLIPGAAALAVAQRKLTPAAAVTGAVCSYMIYAGAGLGGVLIMGVFFILGTAATSWHMTGKSKLSIAEGDSGRRNAGQVLANAGIPALLGLMAFLWQDYHFLFTLMIASAFSSATADTLSSELGNVYGKRFYNILSFKKDIRGSNGVISLEGTAAGVAGSLLIALMYGLTYKANVGYMMIVVFAGTAGNLCDSVLGASLERRRYIGNNAVNFLNTLAAALVALFVYYLF